MAAHSVNRRGGAICGGAICSGGADAGRGAGAVGVAARNVRSAAVRIAGIGVGRAAPAPSSRMRSPSDATGFGARQREINEKEHGKYLEQTERAFPGPFLGTTLRELCDSYAEVAAQSATPTDVWADVVTTLRERERTACATVLDPATARHMKYRATLIEWILEVCADFGFGPTTADLAVQYMVRHARFFCLYATRSRYFPSDRGRPPGRPRPREAKCHARYAS